MAIMPIGSSALARTTAKLLLLNTLLMFSCSRQLTVTSEETIVDNTPSLITQKNIKPFLDQKIHLEVEILGSKPQVFYFVDPKDLASGIALKKNIAVQGTAIGMEAYMTRDEQAEQSTHGVAFADIIAVPVANKASFLSPRLPVAQAKLSGDQTFKLELTDGLLYAVILNPHGLYDKAPIQVSFVPHENNAQLRFKDAAHDTKLTGQLKYNGSTLFDKNSISALKVRVLQGNRLVSSTGRIDKNGAFSLELPSKSSLSLSIPLSLIVEPEREDSGFPTVKRNLDVNEIYEKPHLGTIDLGDLKKPFAATIQVSEESGTPVSSADIYLNARIGAGKALIKKAVDDKGAAIFDQLFEGTYDVAIVLPPQSPFAMRVQKGIKFSREREAPFSIILPKRKPLEALVSDSSHKVISGAHVEFSRIGEIGAFATEDILEDLLFKKTLITNEEGKVCTSGLPAPVAPTCAPVVLDEGRYLAHVIPPPGSELSHSYLTFDFPETSALSLQLAAPEVLKGKIIGPDQLSPAKKAYVTIYVAEANLYNQPKIVANAITDDEGRFEALMPSRATKAVQTAGY